MADPVVHITNGLPDSGTGNITTLGQTLLDGANATLGVTTGAAVTTDASGTLQQYLRGLIKQWAAGTLGVVLGAETTKVIGVTRTADGSGNLITSTSNAMNVSVSNANANGQAAMASSAPVTLANNQTYPTGMSPRAFSVAFATNTRPANVTAYTALDSISNNATAGSVTALISGSISDTNDDPLTITELVLVTTDTGLAGKKVRAYLFNSDPTASSGVGAGDNVAYSQKQAGYVGSLSGVMETGFSDGAVGRLVPSYADGGVSPIPNAAAGGFIVTKPATGAKTLWVQYQAVDGFTPSANSTTLIGTLKGFQGRAS